MAGYQFNPKAIVAQALSIQQRHGSGKRKPVVCEKHSVVGEGEIKIYF
jgi:hypothetical protein